VFAQTDAKRPFKIATVGRKNEEAVASDRTMFEEGEHIGSPLRTVSINHWYYAYTDEQPIPPLDA